MTTATAATPAEASPPPDSWSDRCAYWLSKHDRARPSRSRRRRETEPLILTGHRMSIRVEKGTLLIRDGRTFHGQETRTFRFFKGGLDIPPRIVVVDGAGEITFDALDWLREQGVVFVRLNWAGEVMTVASPSGYVGDDAKVAWQRATRDDPDARLAFAVKVVAAKLDASVKTLRSTFPVSTVRDRAIEKAQDVRSRITTIRLRSIRDLLGFEGTAAHSYFTAWRTLDLTWKGEKRQPIPEDWKRYSSRLAQREVAGNRNATHPINAVLNYAYGMLETRMKIEAIAAGYDPRIGILHEAEEEGRASYALDIMEPERPRVDAEIVRLIRNTVFSPADFTLRSDGVCRLNPEMARRVVQVVEQAR